MAVRGQRGERVEGKVVRVLVRDDHGIERLELTKVEPPLRPYGHRDFSPVTDLLENRIEQEAPAGVLRTASPDAPGK